MAVSRSYVRHLVKKFFTFFSLFKKDATDLFGFLLRYLLGYPPIYLLSYLPSYLLCYPPEYPSSYLSGYSSGYLFSYLVLPSLTV